MSRQSARPNTVASTTSSMWWEKTVDLGRKKEEEPRTFQTLLIKKYKLELLQESLKGGTAECSEQVTYGVDYSPPPVQFPGARRGVARASSARVI